MNIITAIVIYVLQLWIIYLFCQCWRKGTVHFCVIRSLPSATPLQPHASDFEPVEMSQGTSIAMKTWEFQNVIEVSLVHLFQVSLMAKKASW